MNKKIYGLGRSRSGYGKGEIIGVHLNDYTMCIHTPCGYFTMQVLIVEIEDEL